MATLILAKTIRAPFGTPLRVIKES